MQQNSQFKQLAKRTVRRRLFAISVLLLLSGLTIVFFREFSKRNLQIDDIRIKTLMHTTKLDNTLVLDKNGQRIGEYFERYQIHVPVNEVPNHLIQAVLAIEDRNFYEHSGVDFRAVTRAIWSRVRYGRFTHGASTVTQQIIKTYVLGAERSLDRKLNEMLWSLRAEQLLTKNQLLEIYLNSMFLGNGAYGIGAASRRYFAKDVRELSIQESAVIAGLFQSPSRFNPARHPKRAKTRQLRVLEAMEHAKFITREQRSKLAQMPLTYTNYKPINFEAAPWFIDYVREQAAKIFKGLGRDSDFNGSGYRIHTTLDPHLQKLAEDSIARAAPLLNSISKKTAMVHDFETNKDRHAKIEASMIVTDPKSGEILAMVGGRNYRESQFNRTTTAERSPGSAFKPIVYAEALMKNKRWSDTIFVSPINIENYKPRTTEDDYFTETTMLRAFFRSMNGPTVELAQQVGIDAILKRAKSLGVRSTLKHEFGTALGSSDVSMLDLARMYGTIANLGVLNELVSITKITDKNGLVVYDGIKSSSKPKRVLTPQVSFVLNEGMRAVLSYGSGNKGKSLAHIAAGKTGTSNNASDNWFCGSTSSTTSIVWVGTDEHAEIFADVSGGAVAVPIWTEFMSRATAHRPAKDWLIPPGVVMKKADPRSGHAIDSGIPMWFLDHLQPNETPSASSSLDTRKQGEYRRVFTH
jgi:penicillin-binding protein 1A